MRETGTFAGKVALVTGAASGIGRAAAIRYAQEGARVFCADLNLEGAQAVADQIGGGVGAVQVDVASFASNQAMVDAVMAQAGRLDIAFLDAGFYGAAEGLGSVDEAFLDRVIAINLKGTFGGIKAVEPVIAPGDLERVKLRGFGSAQHVAEVALWLSSPTAGFVNGQAQLVDGGLLSTFAPVVLPVGP